MERQPVDSKALRSVGYDPEARVLEVEFVTGKVYQYLQVPPELHAWLMRSPAKGGYFNRMIEGKFEFRRADRPPAEGALDLEAALRASLAPTDDE